VSDGNESLNLKAASEAAHIDANDLKHCAQRGEITAEERVGGWFFRRRDIDEWRQRHLLSVRSSELDACHRSMTEELARNGGEARTLVQSLLREEAIDLALAAKARAGMIRDMTDLAMRTDLVYDGEALFKELSAREEVASTAVGCGAAFLHPRYHDPYLFEESFIAYGRSLRPVYFGAPDGAPTSHFFLVCATDRDLHLHILARLAVLAHGEGLMERLSEAASPADVIAAVREAEAECGR